ncbi:MmgE/PrpD family protein [Liquorilactobacillus uvarum]|uniref:MmgE/PrpD family protein n=3 Tax=Bacillati TaxID=1783272 RepID=UPI00288AEE00|nr:MmgE/PrpD family protein [Liquorilactobacillus uvarum]
MIDKNSKNDFETNTLAIVDQLLKKRIKNSEKIYCYARKALINYLTVLQKSKNKETVKKTIEFFNANERTLPINADKRVTSERAAFLNGFAAHYLDLDDTQANFRGHPSAVIMSALFAITTPEDELKDFLWAFIQGVEIAGKLGKLLNPRLAWQGWHTTGVIGTVAAAASLGVYKKLNKDQLINILSFAVTQASGLEAQSGSDGKPFNAGIAARNAATAFLTVRSGIKANQNPFGNDRGWLMTLASLKVEPNQLVKDWLNPAEIIEPGLWFKTFPFCSAGMASYDASENLYASGLRINDCKKILIHFPQGGDHALRYKVPKTGKEGRFSAEYIVWQILSRGSLNERLFEVSHVPQEFVQLQKIFERKHDLTNTLEDARPTEVEVILKNGSKLSRKVIYPKGSPKNEIDENTLWLNFSEQVGEASCQIQKFLKKDSSRVIKLTNM